MIRVLALKFGYTLSPEHRATEGEGVCEGVDVPILPTRRDVTYVSSTVLAVRSHLLVSRALAADQFTNILINKLKAN